MHELRFNVFGKHIAVTRAQAGWSAYYLGGDGKRRPADFVVPDDIAEQDLATYLGDLFHEFATPKNGTVKQLD